MTEKHLLEQRAALVKTQEDILANAKAENRSFTQEELEKYNRAEQDYDKVNATLEAHRKSEARRLELAQEQISLEERNKNLPDAAKQKKEARAKAFSNWAKNGLANLSQEERTILRETRAMSTTGSAGGYTIPEGFMYELEKALKYYGNVRNVARILPTDSGNDIPYPMVNDTGNVGELLGESVEAASADPTFSEKILKAYKFSSKSVKVSIELLQDSAFNIETYLAEAFAERIGRIENTYFTTGTGSSQPEGVVTGANGTGVTNAAATAIAYADLLNLYHSLDIKYRLNAQWMMNDSTLKAIKLLSIGTNYTQPLWLPSVAAGDPDTILGKPYGLNNDMAAIGASAISTLFGDFSKCIVRDVRSFMYMNRMDEKYIENGQVAFIMFTRSSSHVLNAGTNPIKKLTHAAS